LGNGGGLIDRGLFHGNLQKGHKAGFLRLTQNLDQTYVFVLRLSHGAKAKYEQGAVDNRPLFKKE
jgi:hypothetical protein